MGTAALIRGYRVRVGKSKREVAEHLGLNDAWYDDLEQHDDELESTLTVFQALQLASFLGVRLVDLLGQSRAARERLSLMDLPSRITAHLARSGMSIEQFEDAVNWEIREFLESPVKVAAECPISFLQALAQQLDLDWLCFIPEDHAV